jgi:peroxiredoxin
MGSESSAKAIEFELALASGRTFRLLDVLRRGPVVLNFISGTWCSTCRRHLRNLQNWQERLLKDRKKITILVISAQDLATVRSWLKSNPTPFLFGSDPSGEIARTFGVDPLISGIIQPATVLVDADGSIRLVHLGVGNPSLQEELDSKIA